MIAARISRWSHRWLALLVGLQLAIWTASGVYMTAVDLDFIHGDALVRNLVTPVDPARVRVSPAAALAQHADADGLVLRALPGSGDPVYEVRAGRRIALVDAATGAPRTFVERDIQALAREYYAGAGALIRSRYIDRDPPIEFQSRPLPVWRVDFDDGLETSLYLDPATGRLVTRRHRFWRWFDFLWSLHIMDYTERADVNNPLLRGATLIGATLALSGLWLVAFSFQWRRRRSVRTA